MVLIHYKKTDYKQLFYDTVASIPVEQLIEELVYGKFSLDWMKLNMKIVNNLRIIIDKLSVAIEDLATYGPLRPEETRGLTDDLIPDEE